MSNSLSQRTKTLQVYADLSGTAYYVATGVTAKTTAHVDTKGWSGVRFIVVIGAATNAGTIAIQLNGSDTTTGFVSLGATALASRTNSSSDYVPMIVEVNRPKSRYINATITPATQNSAISGVIVELFNKNGSNPDLSAEAIVANVVVTPVVTESV